MRRIRKYLSRSVTESLVHAFITSRIDYCNSLLYGFPNSHIMKLQRIQNAAVRLVTGTPNLVPRVLSYPPYGARERETDRSLSLSRALRRAGRREPWERGYGTPRFCHVTPLLFPRQLHWLPISYRIKFKILLLTFKLLYGQAPNYLIDLITIKKQSRYSLRSNKSIFLELPGIKTHPTLGDCAFQSAAPYLWNALPSANRNMKTLDTFKTAVKNHFFI